VIAGGGGWTPQSAQALQRFAENWKLPVGNAFRFQDTFDNHHPLYAGDVGIGINPKLGARIKDCDLVLAIGPRLGEMTTGGYTLLDAPKARQKLVHIHASAEELNRVYQADLAINATMNAAARSLEVLTAPPNVPWGTEWAQSANADYLANLDAPGPRRPQKALPGDIDMPAIVAPLQKHLPADALITNGAGNFAELDASLLQAPRAGEGPQDAAGADVSGAMGYGVPAGIAANIVSGASRFTMAGDGDFLMNGQELATASQHRRQEHRRAAQQRHVRHDPHAPGARVPEARRGERHGSANPDFCALAKRLRLCRPSADHPHRGVRAGAAARAGAQPGHADRGDAGPGGDHDARHAERDHGGGAEEVRVRGCRGSASRSPRPTKKKVGRRCRGSAAALTPTYEERASRPP
jgi:acetolactate synthase-1/2/3 large subunit